MHGHRQAVGPPRGVRAGVLSRMHSLQARWISRVLQCAMTRSRESFTSPLILKSDPHGVSKRRLRRPQVRLRHHAPRSETARAARFDQLAADRPLPPSRCQDTSARSRGPLTSHPAAGPSSSTRTMNSATAGVARTISKFSETIFITTPASRRRSCRSGIRGRWPRYTPLQQLTAGKGGDQKEQRRSRQVEVRDEAIDHAELERRVDEELRFRR